MQLTKRFKILLTAGVACVLITGVMYHQVKDLNTAFQAKAEAARTEWESQSPSRQELSKFLARCNAGDMKIEGKPPVLIEDCYRVFERQAGRSIKTDLQQLRSAEEKAFAEVMTTTPQPLKSVIEFIQGDT